ncbi:MAG: hypothetical protein UW37_C0025G0009 [Candidatus Gottesmanbacteria bacterium GW2011_GWA2_44_17]|uniref:Uncharacterized protein n=2 Tax=Candidatus Gottesmaniibacteriota TaxID=1752720 RepID=A0A0G1HIF9_9BACT|nr:MAG: hypothetical protein UV63_C0049G0004 [Microgenomates group bacterium GW2011_GWC1_43_11]KKT37323.1 MAG: hypothetical protein UW22_C0028G0015 [Candidatus Gottesmanbacteria bacterium GW2011_GWB1_44_11c]KKT46373.1 MAG: hypothetical protein UW37_C0025G0009 [Candidatus Gottesmanbacteria bacterium GW2011_GWA2_44_17]HCM82848.1 hypothetical protein [Patescibacteria group bacterium]
MPAVNPWGLRLVGGFAFFRTPDGKRVQITDTETGFLVTHLDKACPELECTDGMEFTVEGDIRYTAIKKEADIPF